MIASCEDQAEFQLGVSFLIHGSLEKRPANHASGSALCICAALPQSGTRGLPDRDVQHIPPKQGARGRVGTATGRVRRLLLLRGREAYHRRFSSSVSARMYHDFGASAAAWEREREIGRDRGRGCCEGGARHHDQRGAARRLRLHGLANNVALQGDHLQQVMAEVR